MTSKTKYAVAEDQQITKPQEEGSEIINAPICWIPITDLKFDPKNVRLSHIESQKDPKTIESILYDIGDIEGLKNDILGAKTVFEPLIVNSNYEVIEGNRRLAACKLILREAHENPISFQSENPRLDINLISKVRCKLLPESTDPTAISIYLISTHMRTKKPWRLFNRALYLTELHKKYKWSYDQISQQGFISKDTAMKTVRCYELTIDYKDKYGERDDGWSKKYIYFWKLLTSKKLLEFRSKEQNISKFSKWIFHKKFKNHTFIRYLPAIISDTSAYEKFIETKEQDQIQGLSCQLALDTLAHNDPAVVDKTFKIIKNTIITIQNFTRMDIRHIRNDVKKMKYISQLSNEIIQLDKELKTDV